MGVFTGQGPYMAEINRKTYFFQLFYPEIRFSSLRIDKISCEPSLDSLFTWGSHLHNQRAFQVYTCFCANMLNAISPLIS